MGIRISELIGLIPLFMLQEDILKNVICAAVVIVLYFAYMMFMYVKCKIRYKQLATIAYVTVGAFIILTTIIFLGINKEIILPIILCIILDIKIALT